MKLRLKHILRDDDFNQMVLVIYLFKICKTTDKSVGINIRSKLDFRNVESSRKIVLKFNVNRCKTNENTPFQETSPHTS